jgi:ribosomal protein S17
MRSLARAITKECRPLSKWRDWRKSVLTEFESEMLARSAIKVKHSAEAAQFLHSEIVLHEGDEPRGRVLKEKRSKMVIIKTVFKICLFNSR